MRTLRFFLSVAIGIGIGISVVNLALSQTPARVYGGLYQPAPSQPAPMRAWRIVARDGLPKDYPGVIHGHFIALHGASLADECKLVLVETEDGRRRALRFNLLAPEDREHALSRHPRTAAAATAAAGRRPYAAVWHVYSKETDAAQVGTFETEHFLFFFGRGTGTEALLLQDAAAVQRMKERSEEVWQFYEQAMHVDMPFARDEAPRKIPVFLLGTGLAKHLRGVAHASNGALVLHPSEVADNTNKFAHEFAHVIQGHQGGYAGIGRHGDLHEGHADWLSYQHNSSRGQKAILSSARYTDFPLFSFQVSYGYWPLLQYFSEAFDPALCVDLWTKNKREGGRSIETPLETLYRIGAERGHWRADDSWGDFADVLTRAAAHKAYWDFVPQMSYLYVLRQSAQAARGDLHRFTRKQPHRTGEYWTPNPERAPGQFGYHTIDIQPSAAVVTAALERTAGCEWRLMGVARDENWKCRYSPVVRAGQTLTFAVDPADRAWSLIVLAVPPHYRAHTRQEEQENRFTRYPFKLKLDGAGLEAGERSPAAVAGVSIVERGAGTEWRFFDEGAEPPATWTSADFDDSKWKLGRAPLGYGEPDVSTEITFGGNPRARHLAAYFRRSFDFEGDPAQVRQLAIQMRVDDGAILYLNGKELVRRNMPAGTVTHRTRAPQAIGGAAETVYHRFVVSGATLKPGRNLLAAEVHQCDAASTDLFFDLQLSLPGEPSSQAVSP